MLPMRKQARATALRVMKKGLLLFSAAPVAGTAMEAVSEGVCVSEMVSVMSSGAEVGVSATGSDVLVEVGSVVVARVIVGEDDAFWAGVSVTGVV